MRVGIIGTNWGRMHIGGFRGAGADVAALCGRDWEKTRRIATEERIPLATGDTAALIAAVDIVVVAGPDALHAEHVLEAVHAGRPVLCEKPLTRTCDEAERVLRAAKQSSVACAVSFPYRQLVPFRALADWLQGRRIWHILVTLRSGFAPEPQTPSGARVGRSGDFGGLSHVLDAALWLAGSNAEWLQAKLTGRPVHSALLHVGLSSGAGLAVSHVLCPEPGIHGSWSLLGDDWEVGFTAGYVPAKAGWCISPVRAFERGKWSDLAPGAEPRAGQLEAWAQAHVETARLFLRAASGESGGNLASFEDGAAVQRLLAATVDSDQFAQRVSLPS
jgi:myo-inositol 2-dehydrogenase / D-chiro-inositol 1-dehydrogenase